MEQSLRHDEKMGPFKGTSTLVAFDAGVVPALMAEGHTLEEAMEIARTAGHMEFVSEVRNLVVNAGHNLVASVLAGNVSSSLMFTYHAIGTGTTTPAYGDTTLTTETARNPIVTKTVSSNYILMRTFFVKSICSVFLKEAGVFGNAATATPGSGTMYNHYLQSFDNSIVQKDLTYLFNLEA